MANIGDTFRIGEICPESLINKTNIFKKILYIFSVLIIINSTLTNIQATHSNQTTILNAVITILSSKEEDFGALNLFQADAIKQEVPLISTIKSLKDLIILHSQTGQSAKMAIENFELFFVKALAQDKIKKYSTYINNLSNEKKWKVYLNQAQDWVILIPQVYSSKPINELGFNKLEQIKPSSLFEEIKNINLKKKDKSSDLIHNFIQLFNKNNQSKKRFIIMGHGSENTSIAGLSFLEYQKLLNGLNSINTEFLYIMSCFSGGMNLIKAHNLLENAPSKFILKKIKYPIVIGSTTDQMMTKPQEKKGIESSQNFLNKFFNSLNTAIKQHNLGIPQKSLLPIKINNVLKNIYDTTLSEKNYPSIWFPGTNSFFRSVNVDNLLIITYSALHQYIIENKLKLGERLKLTQTPKISKYKKGKKLSEITPSPAKISIPPKVKNVLLYPSIIKDVIIELDNKQPNLFISKIPGPATHFIENMNAPQLDLNFIIKNSFLQTGSNKTWIIKNITCKIGNSKLPQTNNQLNLEALIIFLSAKGFGTTPSRTAYPIYLCKSAEQEKYYLFKQENKWLNIKKDLFEAFINNMLDNTTANAEAIKEATAGNETVEEINNALQEFLLSIGINRHPFSIKDATIILNNNDKTLKQQTINWIINKLEENHIKKDDLILFAKALLTILTYSVELNNIKTIENISDILDNNKALRNAFANELSKNKSEAIIKLLEEPKYKKNDKRFIEIIYILEQLEEFPTVNMIKIITQVDNSNSWKIYPIFSLIQEDKKISYEDIAQAAIEISQKALDLDDINLIECLNYWLTNLTPNKKNNFVNKLKQIGIFNKVLNKLKLENISHLSRETMEIYSIFKNN